MDNQATASWAERWHATQTPPAHLAELDDTRPHSYIAPHEQVVAVTPGLHHPVNATPFGQSVAPWLT
jgi:hypothetical protein